MGSTKTNAKQGLKPKDAASPELRQAWRDYPDHKLGQALTSMGLTFKLCNSNNRHYKIFGKARTVDLYATTGTVNAPKHGVLSPCKVALMMPERALKRVLTLANIGF